jgi:hypothetical protein
VIVVFWVVIPCSLVEGYYGFRGTYHLHLQEAHFNPEDGGNTFLKDVGSHLHDITTRKTSSLLQGLQISGVTMDWYKPK